jgi:hypothetical protein
VEMKFVSRAAKYTWQGCKIHVAKLQNTRDKVDLGLPIGHLHLLLQSAVLFSGICLDVVGKCAT